MTPIQQAIHDVRNHLQLAVSNVEMGKPVSAIDALRNASALLERLRALEAARFPTPKRFHLLRNLASLV
jgi:hypothetical protein